MAYFKEKKFTSYLLILGIFLYRLTRFSVPGKSDFPKALGLFGHSDCGHQLCEPPVICSDRTFDS